MKRLVEKANSLKDEAGQAAVEYALLVSVFVVALFVEESLIGLFGVPGILGPAQGGIFYQTLRGFYSDLTSLIAMPIP